MVLNGVEGDHTNAVENKTWEVQAAKLSEAVRCSPNTDYGEVRSKYPITNIDRSTLNVMIVNNDVTMFNDDEWQSIERN